MSDPFAPPNDPFDNPVPTRPPQVVAGPGPSASPYATPVTKTNGMATASLVFGILWMYGIGSILALVFGYLGKAQIARSEGRETGRGLAVAGIVLGWIGVVATIVIILMFAIVLSREGFPDLSS